MNNEQLKERILSIIPNAEVIDNKGLLTVTVPQNKLYALAKNLKETEDTFFDYLVCLTGVDFIKNLTVVYHLRSTKFNHSIVLKTLTENREKPVLDSVCDIWQTADFNEREIFDLLGIGFKNHPDLRRLFLDESSIEGHPLRKDYVNETNIIER